MGRTRRTTGNNNGKKYDKRKLEVISEKEEKLELYLNDFKEQGEKRIVDLENDLETLIKNAKIFFDVEIQSLPMHIRKMTLHDFLSKGGNLNEITKVTENKVETTVISKTNETLINVQSTHKMRTASKTRRHLGSSMTNITNKLTNQKSSRLNSLLSSKRFGSIKDFKHFSHFSQTPAVTPKFDPRNPKTRESGFRSVRPGEKFVMMSTSGSPLGKPMEIGHASTLITLDDGMSINVPLEATKVDEDSRRNLEKLERQLKQYIIN